MPSKGPLQNKGRVVIIGGGPAGSACALMLDRISREQGKSLEITLLEGKRFADGQYNACVGVLSPPLPELLQDELGIPFPFHLQRARIDGYVLYSPRERLQLPDEHPSIALRRVEFDAYMLDKVRERGIEVLPARANDLEFGESHVLVYTENKPLECDVVVGAFGLDQTSGSAFERATAYRTPDFMSSMVTKYHPPAKFMSEFGNFIHAFLPTPPEIEFAGITPKGNHLTINIAGKAVNSEEMKRFLAIPQVLEVLGNPPSLRGERPEDGRFYKGHFPCEVATDYYGDRYVMVGDAAGLVRAFKGKGVTSAVLSSVRAARTILEQGVSREAFHDHYRTANQDILGDVVWGQTARFMTGMLRKLHMADALVRAASSENDLRDAMLGAVSAHQTYRTVLAKSITLRSAIALARSIASRK